MRRFLKLLMSDQAFTKLEDLAQEAAKELRDFDYEAKSAAMSEQLDKQHDDMAGALHSAMAAKRKKQAEAAEKRARNAEQKARAAIDELAEKRRTFRAERAAAAPGREPERQCAPFDVSALRLPESFAMSSEEALGAMQAGEMSDDILRAYMSTRGEDWGLIVEWLITYSTVDDRDCMLNFNWDHGLALVHWIISQPDTDVATVLRAAWLTEPSYHIGELAKGKTPSRSGMGISPHDLLVRITKSVNAGFYVPKPGDQPLAFKPDRPVTWDRDDPAYAAAEAALMPREAFKTIEGRTAKPRLPDGLNWDALC